MSAVEILVVEDSPTQAELLRHLLEAHGYRVNICPNGVEALSSARRHRPDLVLSDVLMPVMDGYTMCRAFKDDEDLKGIPVLILTTLADPQDVILGIEAGVDHYLTKPYREEALLSRVEAVLAAPLESGEAQEEFRVVFSGQPRIVKASRQRIMNLLLSTYENAVQHNRELISTQNELRALNDRLEQLVTERTAALAGEIAERTKAEEEVKAMTQHLWQAAKLATMGELAASIAHELNNPLATVTLRVELLKTQSPENDPRRLSLEIVEKEVDRMAALVANLLQFSRRNQLQISTIDVRIELDKTLELIQYHLRKLNITVLKDFMPAAATIHADRQQLRQVFLNLFSNAADSMANGGTLTLRVRPAGASDQLIIEVCDTGSGIPPEILPKVMEPFFTTKPEGKGTGLGLPICRRIIQEHHGVLDIESEVGKGTTVRIALPLAGGKVTPAADS
ncbi:MAG: hypothetical protein A2064_06270 [Spirochaetes bacterium GWB1_66_5]|nr:MAG: hypothetical protein A2064_06270 [Spirochaetes bacterium GWB1_66_5]